MKHKHEMFWLFEKDTFDEGNPQKMADIAKAMGYDVHWINYVPCGGGMDPQPLGDNNFYPTMVYGSLGLISHVQRRYPRWTPGVWCDQSKLTCQHYYGAIGRYCLNHNYIMFPLNDALRLRDFLFSSLTKGSWPKGHRKIFIRPDSNDKVFHGQVVSENNFDEWLRLANFYVEEGQNVLAVATPVSDIREEWRTVVHNGKVIAASKYSENKQSVRLEDMNDEVNEYVEHVIEETGFQPHPVMCFDVCRLETGVLRILEIGSVNAAGLYACELEPIVKAMSEQAIAEHKKMTAAYGG
tara:strand:- start:363 stop:1250 length:888 start_codon:yes stop_codon:yes gene_type:complete